MTNLRRTIEILRIEMEEEMLNTLDCSYNNEKLLELSSRLDKVIVEYIKTTKGKRN